MPDHITAVILQPMKMFTISKVFKSSYSEMLVRYLQQLGITDISGNRYLATPPWTFPNIATVRCVGCEKSSENSIRVFDPAKIEQFLATTFPYRTKIYTDGSRSADGKCGASIVIPSIDRASAYRINDGASIDNIELNALARAITVSLKNDLTEPVFVTDSLNTLRRFEGVPPAFEISTVQACRELLSRCISPTICWIPAHTGVYYNEIADHLAKKASCYPTITESILPTLDDANASFLTSLKLKWQQASQSHATGKAYHSLFPMGRPASLKITPRAKDVAITRLRLHSCSLNLYLSKIGLRSDSLCEVCMTPEDVPHFLTACAKHKELSDKLATMAKEHKQQPSIKIYLQDEPFLDIIWTYICKERIKI